MLVIYFGTPIASLLSNVLPFFGRPLPRPFLDLREFLLTCAFFEAFMPRAAAGQPPKGASSLVE